MSTGHVNGLGGTSTAKPAARASVPCTTATEIWSTVFFVSGTLSAGDVCELKEGATITPSAEVDGDAHRPTKSTHGAESCRG